MKDAFPPLTVRYRLGRLARLARKELNESLRDRRTVVTLVLMPLLLYPILAIAFQQMLLGSMADQLRPPEYRLGFATEAEGRAVLRYLSVGRRFLETRRQAERPAAGDEAAGSGQAAARAAALPELRFIVPEDDVEEQVRRGEVDVSVRLRPPGPFVPRLNEPLAIDCDLLYRPDSPRGADAVRYLERLLAAANQGFLFARLDAAGVTQRPDPVLARVEAVVVPGARRSSWLPTLVPLVLILMTITGAVYPAIDLTAGERERGTLEVLVAAPIPRLGVLFAKYVAVLTVAMLTALVNLGAMSVTLSVTGLGRTVFGGAGLSPLVLLQVLALLLLFAAFFSGMLLAVTSFARSFKEAQAYLIPLMLVALTPGIMSLMPGLQLEGPLAVAPLLNVVLLARDLFEGDARPAVAAVVVLTTLLYAVAAVAVAARVFGTEAVLAGSGSGWSDLFRRPARARPAPTPSAALTCLALMFPVYFVLTGGLAQLTGLSLGVRLALLAGANLLLFGGLPLLVAWLGRVRLATGLRLARPGWQGCIAALLLGLSLWPFVHELILLLRSAGFSTLRPEQLEQVRDLLGNWRAFPPAAIVLGLAVLPAVLEELFFRGYLLSAFLSTGRPAQAIVGQAVLFALFHLLVTDTLAVERLPPSLLLGLLLGWLCWHTGSVFPGIVLHTAHNTLLVLLGYYEPVLARRGWLVPGQDHLPPGLLLAAGVVALLALLWVWRLPGPTGREDRAGVSH